jgi:hypothetical protein
VSITQPDINATGRYFRAFALFLVLWLASRTVLVLLGLHDLPFYPGGQLTFDDLSVYAGWLPSLSEGVTPLDDMWQYPPLAGVFFLVGNLGPAPIYALMGAIIAVDLALAIVLFRYRANAGWFWIVAGLAIGPILVARFDVVPTLFAVLAVIHHARPVAVGVWAALGASLKVWPFLMLVVVPPRQMIRAGTAFLLVAAGIVLVTVRVFAGGSGFLGGQGSRGLQVESVFALPFVIAKWFGADVEYVYRYGSMEVESAGAGIAASLAVVAMFVLLGWLAVAWWRGILEKRSPADVALVAVLFSVVTSRVFSPQYSIWLLGIGALCWATYGSQVRRSVGLILAAAILAQILYPWGYGALLTGQLPATIVQILRIGLVVAATVLAAKAVLGKPAPARSDQEQNKLAATPVG